MMNAGKTDTFKNSDVFEIANLWNDGGKKKHARETSPASSVSQYTKLLIIWYI